MKILSNVLHRCSHASHSPKIPNTNREQKKKTKRKISARKTCVPPCIGILSNQRLPMCECECVRWQDSTFPQTSRPTTSKASPTNTNKQTCMHCTSYAARKRKRPRKSASVSMIRSLSISIVSSSVVNLDKGLPVFCEDAGVLIGELSSGVERDAQDGRRGNGDGTLSLKFNAAAAAATDSKQDVNGCFREWCTFPASWSSYYCSWGSVRRVAGRRARAAWSALALCTRRRRLR